MDRKVSKVLAGAYLVLGIMLASVIGKAVYAQHMPNQLTVVETVPEPVLQETVQEEPSRLAAINGRKADFGTVSLKDSLQLHFGGGDIVNILLIGQDAGSGSGARSDTMILCTFNKEDNTITLTSFLRDLYVKIPGYKNNRINAAYRFGGTQLLNETLYENFGVQVDGNIQVDFECFERIIDALGGITLELTAAEAAFVNKHVDGSELDEGEHLLTGRQALLHARNRYDTDGDFSRTNRQRKLLSALLKQFKNVKLTEMLGVIQEIRPMITTDISGSDLSCYALTLFPMLSGAEIRTQAIPVEGGYSYRTIDGKSELVPDLQKNIQALEDTLS